MMLLPKGLVKVETFDEFDQFDEIIDVRSPTEFIEDNIPNSINCPVLDDQQRIEIGTLYKQHSPFEAKRLGAAYVAENIAKHIRGYFKDKPENWKPLILCWRGGQRSGSMTLIFRRIGWDALQLAGGYKAYRKEVINILETRPQQLSFRIVCGQTGNGKSKLLHELANRGEQVLDLEDLACHKGSVLGVLPNTAQPSQKLFETRLAHALLKFSPQKPVYIESESRKIGTINLPDQLLKSMRASPCLRIDAALDARINFLIADYDYFLNHPENLIARLETLHHLLGREQIEEWKLLIDEKKWSELVSELLQKHYDPLYKRSQKQNFSSFDTRHVFTTDDLSNSGIKKLANQITAYQSWQ